MFWFFLKDLIPVIILGVLVGCRRRQLPREDIPAEIRGLLAESYDERGYLKDPQ